MKNSNNTIGNRTRDLPVCSAVPQSTAQPLKESRILQRMCHGVVEGRTVGSVDYGVEAEYSELYWRFLTVHTVAT